MVPSRSRDRLAQIGEERRKGFISPETERELGELEAATRKSLRLQGDLEFDLELKLDAAVVPAVGVGIKVSPARLLVLERCPSCQAAGIGSCSCECSSRSDHM